MKKFLFALFFYPFSFELTAQTKYNESENNSPNENHLIKNISEKENPSQSELSNIDSIISSIIYLKEITLVGFKSKTDIQQMPEIVGTNIYAGKKSSLVVMENVQGNIVNNTMRQVLAKVPGIQIWESDGSGIQIGISTRGLSPNRSWEFNVRQNGYDIVADPFGYPEAYYNPQMQAVQRIEIVRGQAALQYGPQFGGMVNYILKNGSEIDKPFQFETQQTIGSNGLFNIYNAIGGETKKFHYYGFFDHRSSNGWRENSQYYTNVGFGNFTYRFNDKFSLTGEIMHSHIRSKQAGGLTDEQVKRDARQSLRSRNWLDIKWTTAALIGNYIFDKYSNSRLNIKVFGIFADRGNIGNLKPITIKDSINPVTLQYDNRQVDQDLYTNFGTEARFLTDYSLKNIKNTVSAGLRYYHGNTDRSRLGLGDQGTDFNLNFIQKNQDLDLTTSNAAAFVENLFRINSKFSVIPGLRLEHIIMNASGRLNYDTSQAEVLIKKEKRNRNFLLAGIGAEYSVSESTKLYSNYSQAYRPMLFYDVTVSPETEISDPNMKDSKGFNFDLGYRGKIEDHLLFDMSGFILHYDNRIGIIKQQRSDGSYYNYRTNVGESISKGFEGMIEISPLLFSGNRPLVNFRAFVSYSYTDARYGNFKIISIDNETNNLKETNIKNNKVENAPENILRTGLTTEYKNFSITYQFSYVDDAFTDANNTLSDVTAQVGLIEAYAVSDLSAALILNNTMNVKAGINNLFDSRYVTRRAPSIPGPGALPSDGRSIYLSVGAKF